MLEYFSRDDLKKKVDEMILFKKDVDTINKLFALKDDNFLVKVIEEVILGKIIFPDFEPILSNYSYTEILGMELEAQEKLKREINTLERRNIDKNTYKLGIKNNKELENATREALLFSLLSSYKQGKEVDDEVIEKIGENIENSKKALVVFSGDYIYPVDYKYQVLDKTDYDFMDKNGLNEEEMKKLKSRVAFIKSLKLREENNSNNN